MASSNTAIRKPQLTRITQQTQLLPAVNSLIESMQLFAGQNPDKLERAVTYKDLLNSGFNINTANLGSGDSSITIPDTSDQPDMSVPPAMTGVTFNATFNNILIFWNPAGYKNHAYVEVWIAAPTKTAGTSTTPTTVTDATLHGICTTTAYYISVLPGDEWRIWVRNVSKQGVVGPWYSIDGNVVDVPQDPLYLITKISGEIRESDLYKDLGTKIDDSATRSIKNASDLVAQGNTLTQQGTLLASHTQSISAANSSISNLQTIATNQGNTITQMQTTLSSYGTEISSIKQINTDQNSTIASIQTTINSHGSAITNIQQINSNQDATIASQGSTISSHGASISNLNSITSTHNSQIASMQSTLTSHGTSISSVTSIANSADALIRASYTLKIDTGGAVSGFGLSTDGTSSLFLIRADRFAIGAPGTGSVTASDALMPFIVSNGQVLIKNAAIDQAFINSIVASKITADYINALTLSAVKITGGTLNIGNTFMVDANGNATMNSATIIGAARSSNFVSGTSGWALLANGNAELNNATVRGTVYASAGWFQGQVYAEKLVGGAFTNKRYTMNYIADANVLTGPGTGIDTSWRTAKRVTVARGMSASRTLRMSGAAGHFKCSISWPSNGSGTQDVSATFTFEARIVRDGYVVEETATHAVVISGTSTPSGGGGGSSSGLISVTMYGSVPADSATHYYDIQFRYAGVSASSTASGMTAVIGSSADDLVEVNMYIESGDLT